MRLPRLYPIVDVATLEARHLRVEAFTRQLLQGGAEILQLRDKHGSPQQVLAYAEGIGDVLAGSGCMPVMNDRADLALLAGWRAVHVGARDLLPAAVRRVFGPDAHAKVQVGVSTHRDEQVIAADAGTADYIAIGPVFGTHSKADAEPAVGLEGVRRARALTRKPLVAIGGIDRENAAAVMAAGADSIAVIGGLFSDSESVEMVVRDFLRKLR